MRTLAASALVALFLAGCSNAPPGNPGSDAGTGPGVDAGAGLDASAGADAAPLDAGPDFYPTFERDIVPIFNRTCGSSTSGCHDAAAYGPMASMGCRGWLSLVDAPLGGGGCTPIDLYTRLTTLDAWGCESMDPRVPYVTACNTDRSYLFRKIGGGPYCTAADGTASQPMPQPVLTGTPLPDITPAEVELVRSWIMVGAPRDGQPRIDCSATPPVGNPPTAAIWHPGTGEMRQAGSAVPMIGRGMDVEDGALTGTALVWVSDVEGEIGRGETFSWTPRTLGAQTITLTVTDSDLRTGTASIALTIIP